MNGRTVTGREASVLENGPGTLITAHYFRRTCVEARVRVCEPANVTMSLLDDLLTIRSVRMVVVRSLRNGVDFRD